MKEAPREEDLSPVERLREIVRILRAPGGCPWDREQTHESLVPNLLEEAYEVAAAIRVGDDAHVKEELGDLLLQVIFHADLAAERGAFCFADVCREISAKLIRRHPHVFADGEADTTARVLQRWEEIKAEERQTKGLAAQKSFLESVGEGLPALMRAAKIQKRAAQVGFDWPDSQGAWEKIEEEVQEIEAARATGSRAELQEEMGDLLFAVVNLARKEGFCPELLLDAANQKFISRFAEVERKLNEKGSSLDEASLEEMEALWCDGKKLEPPNTGP